MEDTTPPGASGKLPEERKAHGENTDRMMRILEEKLEPTVKTIGSMKIVIGAVVALVVFGYAAGVYFGAFATKKDLEATNAALAVHTTEESTRFANHERDEAAKTGALDASMQALKDDHVWERLQIEKIAERVGAQRVAPTKRDP